MRTRRQRNRRRGRARTPLLTSARTRLLVSATVALAVVTSVVPSVGPAIAQGDPEWLVVVNRYRAVAGLGPVGENSEASAGAMLHSQYLVRNRTSGHDQQPSRPGFTPAGLRAGMTGNVATGYGKLPTQRYLIEEWMTAPFHGLGMIRPDSTAFGFAVAGTAKYYASTLPLFWEDYQDPNLSEANGFTGFDEAVAKVIDQHPELTDAGWDASGTRSRVVVTIAERRFEVRDGVVAELGAEVSPASVRTIVWPGDGTAVPLVRYFGSENPNPLTSCPGWTSASGLPILMRRGVPTEVAQATMVDSTGAAQTLCILTAATYANRDPGTRDYVRFGLAQDGAVVLIPKKPLVPGRSYTMNVVLTDGVTVRWTFAVSTDSSIGLPPGHPLAGAPLPGVSSQLPTKSVMKKKKS